MNTVDRVSFIRQALNVRRYHQHITLETDTVGKHSAGVALFLLLLEPDCRKELLVHAITHDLGEFEVGDLPAPTKRKMSPEFKEELDAIEDGVLHDLGFGYSISVEEYALLKLCDYLDGFTFCVEELERGNRSMRKVGDTYASYIPQYLNQHRDKSWGLRAFSIVNNLTKRWNP